MTRTTTVKRKGAGKGSAFEREISKKLSLWWTEGERDDVFWRTSQSGGRATTRFKSGKSTAGSGGDLTFIDEIGKPLIDYFLIELKRGYTKDIDVLSVIDNGSNKKPPTLLQFWEQAERDRELNNRAKSLVIFKRDKHQICVMSSFALFFDLARYLGFYEGVYVDFVDVDFDRYRIITLDNFLEYVPPSMIKRLWNQM